jgi:hypothetical protein
VKKPVVAGYDFDVVLAICAFDPLNPALIHQPAFLYGSSWPEP